MGVFCKNHSAGTEAQNIGNDDNIAWAYRTAFDTIWVVWQ